MKQHAVGLRTKTCLLLTVTLLVNQLVLADTESTNSDKTQSATKPKIVPGSKSLHISPSDFVEIEGNSTLAAEEPEPRNSELQKLLNHDHESHMHLRGEVMLNDDASLERPSLDDIDGLEVDITIDFE